MYAVPQQQFRTVQIAFEFFFSYIIFISPKSMLYRWIKILLDINKHRYIKLPGLFIARLFPAFSLVNISLSLKCLSYCRFPLPRMQFDYIAIYHAMMHRLMHNAVSFPNPCVWAARDRCTLRLCWWINYICPLNRLLCQNSLFRC